MNYGADFFLYYVPVFGIIAIMCFLSVLCYPQIVSGTTKKEGIRK